MKTPNILNHIKALNSYVDRYKEASYNFEHTRELDEEGDLKETDRDDFIGDSNEWHKIISIYKQIKKKILNDFPEDFYELMDPNSSAGAEELEELSREIKYVLETLEGIKSTNKDTLNNFTSFEEGETFNNTPFNKQEKEEIKVKLKEIENHLIEVIEKQKDVKEETKQSDIKVLKEQVDDLIKSSETSGRSKWKARFESFSINVFSTLLFSQEARMTFFWAVHQLFIYLYQVKLLLPPQ